MLSSVENTEDQHFCRDENILRIYNLLLLTVTAIARHVNKPKHYIWPLLNVVLQMTKIFYFSPACYKLSCYNKIESSRHARSVKSLG